MNKVWFYTIIATASILFVTLVVVLVFAMTNKPKANPVPEPPKVASHESEKGCWMKTDGGIVCND